jgi:hypothetical protein
VILTCNSIKSWASCTAACVLLVPQADQMSTLLLLSSRLCFNSRNTGPIMSHETPRLLCIVSIKSEAIAPFSTAQQNSRSLSRRSIPQRTYTSAYSVSNGSTPKIVRIRVTPNTFGTPYINIFTYINICYSLGPTSALFSTHHTSTPLCVSLFFSQLSSPALQ